MFIRKLTFRCRPSTVRGILDLFSKGLTEEIIDLLRQMNVFQFTRMPPFQQETPLTIEILSCWDIKSQTFYIGGKNLAFTPDEVAMIIGMPNRGEEVTWSAKSGGKYTSIDIRNRLEKHIITSTDSFVKLYLQFLITNLFFPYHNYKVPEELYKYGSRINIFSKFNWPEAIWRVLVSQFDTLAHKFVTKKPLGYMSGFVTILMIWIFEHCDVITPSSKTTTPRMMRWTKCAFWNTKRCVDMFTTLEPHQGHHEMKRSFPWEEAVTISDSDSEEDKQDRAKRDKKDCSSENLKDITSEGTLIRMAGMYQEYMKRIPIPTFSGSIVPFTSWQGLAKSLKQLYGQPLHYLTNALLKQWDRERFGSDNEHQPLDAVVHPVKAQTLIWLTEELHRLTASPYHLAKLWACDPMYHSQIDPFLSY